MERKSLTLNRTTNKIYTLVSATHEEVLEIEKLYHEGVKEHEKYPFLQYLKAYGHADSVDNESLKPFIPVRHVHKVRSHNIHGIASFEDVKEYYCYGFPTVNLCHNLMLHEDRVSSFKCACEIIMSEYFLILESTEEVVILSPYPIDKTSVACSYQREGIETQEIDNLNTQENVSDNSGDTSIREENKGERETDA